LFIDKKELSLMTNKQVNSSHYRFSSYLDKPRWASVWHQLNEVLRLAPKSVLEAGPGPGVFKAAAEAVGLKVETLDIDPDLQPDHVGSVLKIPLEESRFDVACAFQVLEHLPFDSSLTALDELARVAKTHVVISLPDVAPYWQFILSIPWLGSRSYLFPIPLYMRKGHTFDGEHYWEINKKGYKLGNVIEALEKSGKLKLLSTFRVFEKPYHRFFILRKND
jgi:SAM-dependent methyltransferase